MEPTLTIMTDKKIAQEVKRCVEAAGYNGGYFIGPSHNILTTPWQNIKILRDAIEKYRKYPIAS